MIRKALFIGVVSLALGATAAYAFPPIDLASVAGRSDFGSDGTFWKHNLNQPTGTGVFDPFNRLQFHGMGPSGDEEGMGTDAGGAYDNVAEAAGHNWNHTLTLGNLSKTMLTLTASDGEVQSGEYYTFTLDINEPNSPAAKYISLDDIKIYTLAAGGSTALATTGAVVGAGGVLRYHMDAGGDQTVYLNHDLGPGSGKDDMTVYIPTSFFASASATDIVYFYSYMGASPNMEADWTGADGFEEWAADVKPGTPVDGAEPGTLTLLGLGLVGLIGPAIRRRKK